MPATPASIICRAITGSSAVHTTSGSPAVFVASTNSRLIVGSAEDPIHPLECSSRSRPIDQAPRLLRRSKIHIVLTPGRCCFTAAPPPWRMRSRRLAPHRSSTRQVRASTRARFRGHISPRHSAIPQRDCRPASRRVGIRSPVNCSPLPAAGVRFKLGECLVDHSCINPGDSLRVRIVMTRSGRPC